MERADDAPSTPLSRSAPRFAVGLAVALAIYWFVGVAIFVLGAGALAGVALGAATDWLQDHGVKSRGAALGIIVGSQAVLIGATAWLLAPEISAQTDQLVQQIPIAWQSLLSSLQRYEWGRALARPPATTASLEVVSNATGFLGSTLQTIAELVIVGFLGLYLAADPEPYRNGLLRLVPHARRRRAREVLEVVGLALRRWLLSRLVAMLIVGVFTALGLWLLHIQIALTLGILSGLLTFIPYIGAIISAVPAVLVALTQGWAAATYVVILYLVVHFIEGYLVTPLIEQRAVQLPPALSIAAQVILWTLAGVWGLVLASPFAATLLIVVNMLYIEDQLGEPSAVPTEADEMQG